MKRKILALYNHLVKSKNLKKTSHTKRRDCDIRPRDHLDSKEISKVLKWIKGGHRVKGELFFHLIYRHGLEAHQIKELKWGDISRDRSNLLVPGRMACRLSKEERFLFGEWACLSGEDQKRVKEELKIFPNLKSAQILYIMRIAGERAGLPFPINSRVIRKSGLLKKRRDGWSIKELRKHLGAKENRVVRKLLGEDY